MILPYQLNHAIASTEGGDTFIVEAAEAIYIESTVSEILVESEVSEIFIESCVNAP